MNIERILASYTKHESYFGLDVTLEVLKQIADTLAPSQTATSTRAPIINQMIERFDLADMVFDQNYKDTGNGLPRSTHTDPSVLFIAHIDQISYILDQQRSGDTWQLIPYCKHLSRIETMELLYDIALEVMDLFELRKDTVFRVN